MLHIDPYLKILCLCFSKFGLRCKVLTTLFQCSNISALSISSKSHNDPDIHVKTHSIFKQIEFQISRFMHFDIPKCFFPLIYLFVISIHYPCLVNKVNNNCSIFIIITQYNHSPSIYSNNNLQD